MILEGSYCRIDLGPAYVVDPNALDNGPLVCVYDELWVVLAEAFRVN